MEKPACVKTHLRNMIIVPEMIGSVVGIHQGKTFNQVEIKVWSHGGFLCASIYCTHFRVKWWADTWASFLSRTNL